MGNTNRRIECLIIFTVCFLIQSWAQDPFLAWTFEELLIDSKPSGANPEFQVDAFGTFHVLYWDKNRDKLVYAHKASEEVSWEREWVDSTSGNGYKSALFLAPNGRLHIAYLSNIGGKAWLNYAQKGEGEWMVEPVPIPSNLGKYGVDEEFPIYAQASLDLALGVNGEPLISYFDGKVFESILGYCGSVSDALVNIYTEYELDMGLAYKEGESWRVIDSLEVPYKGPQTCLAPNGDRFGEFNNIMLMPDSSLKIFTNSLHNNELIVYSGSSTDLSNWEFTVLDSVKRFANSGLRAGEGDREGFDFIQVKQVSDSLIHMIYGVSDLYGFASPNTYIRAANFNRRTFFYTRIHTDSMGVEGYTPDFEEMVPRITPTNPNTHDGNLRSLYTLAVADDNNIFLGHYNYTTNTIVFHESTSGGDNWITDTLGIWQTNSPLRSQIYGDSLQVMFYDSHKDRLMWASRPLDTADWNIRPVFPSRRFGNVLDSYMSNSPDATEIFVAFSETVEDQLYLGKYEEFSWSYEPIDQAGIPIEKIWIGQGRDENPVIVYSSKSNSQLKLAYRDGANWSCEEIEGEVHVTQLQGTVSSDSIYVVYFDLNSQTLKWATSSNVPPFNWKIGAVEPNSIEPVGESISLEMDENENLHLSYRNIFNPLFKYAVYSPGLSTWSVDTISTPEQNFAGENDLALMEDGRVLVAFRDELSNKLYLAEQQVDSSWDISQIPTLNNNFNGFSLKTLVDKLGQIWVFYSSISNQNELRGIRKNISGQWEEILILNNRGLIAQNFQIHMEDGLLNIIGEMTHPENSGIGILWVDQAIPTSSSSTLPESAFLQLWPNPVEDQLNILFPHTNGAKARMQIFNVNGEVLFQKDISPLPNSAFYSDSIWVEFLPKGLYVCIIHSGNQRFVKKFVH